MNKKGLGTRTEQELEEKRNNLFDELDEIYLSIENEKRCLTEEEINKIDEIENEINKVERTLKFQKEKRKNENIITSKKTEEEEQRTIEENNFLKFIRGEERALSIANNGGIIPQHIANKIIEKVKELSPLYSMSTIYNVGGDLIFPKYGADSLNNITAAYVEDLTELTESTGKFTTVKLENHIIGSLAKISKSLINRTDFDLLGFVIRKVAEAIAEFLEKELINGNVKMKGLITTNNFVEVATKDKITGDDLIDLQMSIPETFQSSACWIMHKNTLKLIRKIKDANGNYMLGQLKDGFGYELLNKRVYISENCPNMVDDGKFIFYGDMSGLYTKLAKGLELQILNEKYATQHAIGVVAYVECDSDIVEEQKIVALKNKA